jgi:hypothetical protein
MHLSLLNIKKGPSSHSACDLRSHNAPGTGAQRSAALAQG